MTQQIFSVGILMVENDRKHHLSFSTLRHVKILLSTTSGPPPPVDLKVLTNSHVKTVRNIVSEYSSSKSTISNVKTVWNLVSLEPKHNQCQAHLLEPLQYWNIPSFSQKQLCENVCGTHLPSKHNRCQPRGLSNTTTHMDFMM